MLDFKKIKLPEISASVASYFIPIFPFLVLKKLRHIPTYPATKLLSFKLMLGMTLNETNNIFVSLNNLHRKFNEASSVNRSNLVPDVRSEKLKLLFNKSGSDKASNHGYEGIYFSILESLKFEARNILEIGIGTNNPKLVSNMGKKGTPGASLKAMRDYSENFHIVGVDIDEEILFSEERISTFQLDQLSEESWVELIRIQNGKKFDFIIDDGLHSPTANLNTILYGLGLLKDDGIMLIEDIPERALPIWELAINLLPKSMENRLFNCGDFYVIVLFFKTAGPSIFD